MRILIVGYGNPSRQDDGVGLAVVNGLRLRLGLSSLVGSQDGFDELGRAVDTVFLQQKAPELAETLSQYGRVVFVDAHVGAFPEAIRRVAVRAGSDHAMVSHHVGPSGLLEIARRLYGNVPEAELISIRGHSFDFGESLSPLTAQVVAEVVGQLWQEVSPYVAAGN